MNYCRAVITNKTTGRERRFRTCDTELIADYLEDIVGDSADEELSGVPTFIEASSWCELAPIGASFEREGFIIYIEDDD